MSFINTQLTNINNLLEDRHIHLEPALFTDQGLTAEELTEDLDDYINSQQPEIAELSTLYLTFYFTFYFHCHIKCFLLSISITIKYDNEYGFCRYDNNSTSIRFNRWKYRRCFSLFIIINQEFCNLFK